MEQFLTIYVKEKSDERVCGNLIYCHYESTEEELNELILEAKGNI